jgi:hypothetical protein
MNQWNDGTMGEWNDGFKGYEIIFLKPSFHCSSIPVFQISDVLFPGSLIVNLF